MAETSNRQRAAALVEQGAAALRSGDTTQAFGLLREAVKLDPNNEHAWLWLAGAVPSDDQRRECLKRVLAINPNNVSAQRGLARLTAEAAPASSAAAALEQSQQQSVLTPADAQPAAASPIQVPQTPRSEAVFDPLMSPKAGPAPSEPPAQSSVFDPLATSPAPRIEAPQEPAQQPVFAPASASVEEPVAPEAEDRPESGAAPIKRLSRGLAPEGTAAEAIPDSLRAAPKKSGSSRLALLALIAALIVLGALVIVYLLSQQARQQPVGLLVSPIPEASPLPTPSALPTSMPTPTISATEYLAQAKGLVDAGDYTAAIEQYSAALALAENAETFFGRAQAYYALNDFAKAADDYSSVIRLDNKNASAYHERGRSRFRTGDNQGAIADFSEALKLKPDDEPSYLRRGIVYRAIGKNSEAEADFSESIRLAPEKLDSYYHRGMARLALQQYEPSLADFNKALAINPEHVLSYAGRGAVQIALKQYGQALKDCNTAIERDNTLIEPLLCRGQAYAGLKEYQQALNDFNSIITRYPREPAAYRERARVKLATKDSAGARADLQQAATIYKEQNQTAEYEAVQKELDSLK